MLRLLLPLALLLAACDPESAPSAPVDSAPDAGDRLDASLEATDAGSADAGRADAGTACDLSASPTRWIPCADGSFLPDTPTEDWQHTSTGLLVVTQGAARHRGVDTIVNPGQEQVLIGKFAYGPLDKDLKDERVEVWVETNCGLWARFATVSTSEEGQHGTINGVEDDGGRVFFRVPAADALPLGSYRVKMLVKGDHSSADFWLHVWQPGTRVVVSDIDGTITTNENDGLWTAFDPSAPTPREAASDTFRIYASKGYRVVFLTARPEFTTPGTRRWFSDNGFPEGVFHLSQADIGEHGAEAQVYKSNYLSSLARNAGVVIEWAYGNKETDLDTYLLVGAAPDHLQLVAGEYSGDLKGANQIQGYVTEAARVTCLPPIEQ